MKKSVIFLAIVMFLNATMSCQNKPGNTGKNEHKVQKIIFVYGNGMEKEFIKYIAQLTGMEKPKICFFPTATADDERAIGYWYRLCEDLPLEPTVLKTFISSYTEDKSFEEQILSSDAIIVGGGNTLNMIAIWKAGLSLAMHVMTGQDYYLLTEKWPDQLHSIPITKTTLSL